MTVLAERPSTVEPSVNKRGLLAITAVMLAAFGPYLIASLRTEQIVVYGMALALVPLTLPRLRPTPHLAGAVTCWAAFAGVVVISTVAPPVNRSRFLLGQPLGGLDNVLLPLAVVGVVLGLLAVGADRERLLARAAFWTVVLMLVNTATALLSSFAGLTWDRWWSSSDSSTAANAALLGRYSGLINQPAEAGVLYGLALICALFLWPHRPELLLPIVLVLTVGGVLTTSKVFLGLVIPIVVWQLLRIRGGRGGRLLGAALLLVAAWGVVQSGALSAWSGSTRLERLFSVTDRSLASQFSGNRYGATSTLRPVTDAVMSGPRWMGFGGGGLQVAYDSGFVETMVLAGIFGLLAVLVLIVVLFSAWQRMDRGRERTMLGCLVVLLAVANLGVPSFTANRAATVVWVLLTLLVVRPKESARHVS
jgi:hypothetical protein